MPSLLASAGMEHIPCVIDCIDPYYTVVLTPLTAACSSSSIGMTRHFCPSMTWGVNLSDFFRLDAQDDIVGLDGRDIFAIGISLRDRNGARLLELLL